MPSEDIYWEAAKATLNLIVAVLITGFLSFVLAQRAARQASDDEESRVLTGALQELKAGYEHIQVARFHLTSQRSGSALAVHIGAISEARALLQKVQRERFVLDTPVYNAIQRMLNYLAALANEYKENYEWVAEAALAEERDRRQVVEGLRERLGPVPPLDPDLFQGFMQFMNDKKWDRSDFHSAYEEAKGELQRRLDKPGRWTRQRQPAPYREASAS